MSTTTPGRTTIAAVSTRAPDPRVRAMRSELASWVHDQIMTGATFGQIAAALSVNLDDVRSAAIEGGHD